jgi:hypothetical protein
MAFSLALPASWGTQGWKVKIRDRERLEPPHVTVLFRAKAWRWDLRAGRFMDDVPNPKDVPQAIIDSILEHQAELHAAWDERYPENPVAAREDDDD